MLGFADAACLEVPRAGGKGASLARMSALGLPVPPGFVVPAECLAAALPDGGEALRAALLVPAAEGGWVPDAEKAQAIVGAAEVPDAVAAAYEQLGPDTQPASPAGTGAPVAVRSSACAEDSEAASYAGQQETFLHVRGAADVRARVRDCWASFFSERALFYRQRKGSLEDLGMAVVVQRMVQAEVAGVLFTCDPIHNRRDRMVVEAVLGLGEAAVSGQVTPDHYVLKRDGTLKRAQVAQQPFAVVARPEGGVEERPLDPEQGGAQKLREQHLRELARIGDDLEQRLGRAQDIEWAIEGGEIFVLQARPVTT